MYLHLYEHENLWLSQIRYDKNRHYLNKNFSKWENNETYPDITLLPLIANIFEVTVDELLGVESIKQDEYVKTLKKQGYTCK